MMGHNLKENPIHFRNDGPAKVEAYVLYVNTAKQSLGKRTLIYMTAITEFTILKRVFKTGSFVVKQVINDTFL